jgi:hypothetical protein
MSASQKFALLYGGIKVSARMNDQKKQVIGLNPASHHIIARRRRSHDTETC